MRNNKGAKSKSSVQSEYGAIESACCKLIWLKQMLQELGFRHPKSMVLRCHMQAIIYIVNNLVFHKHTKYIEIDCHFA